MQTQLSEQMKLSQGLAVGAVIIKARRLLVKVD